MRNIRLLRRIFWIREGVCHLRVDLKRRSELLYNSEFSTMKLQLFGRRQNERSIRSSLSVFWFGDRPFRKRLGWPPVPHQVPISAIAGVWGAQIQIEHHGVSWEPDDWRLSTQPLHDSHSQCRSEKVTFRMLWPLAPKEGVKGWKIGRNRLEPLSKIQC